MNQSKAISETISKLFTNKKSTVFEIESMEAWNELNIDNPFSTLPPDNQIHIKKFSIIEFFVILSGSSPRMSLYVNST